MEVIIACCATVVVHFTVLSTAGVSHHCLLCCSWCCLLYSIEYSRCESSLFVVPQLMKSTLRCWVLQVGVIIACCATADEVHSTVLSTAGGSHHCLLCDSWCCPLYSTEYRRWGVIIACCTTVDDLHCTELSTIEWEPSLLALLQLILSNLKSLSPMSAWDWLLQSRWCLQSLYSDAAVTRFVDCMSRFFCSTGQRFPKWLSFLQASWPKFVCISHLSHAYHMPIHFVFFELIITCTFS